MGCDKEERLVWVATSRISTGVPLRISRHSHVGHPSHGILALPLAHYIISERLLPIGKERLQTRMRQKKKAVRRKPANTASPDPDKDDYGNMMEALRTVFPTVANPGLHSPEELITAIAKLLRLKDITMEVLRDTSIGAYVRDLCDHPSVQVSSAARIAIDCFQTGLFEWADNANWSKEIIAKACLEADREIRHKACKSASLATIDSTKQPIVLGEDKNISNNSTSNVNVNIRNDYYIDNSKPNIIDLSSCSSYEEDSFYTPSEPSEYPHKRVCAPDLANKRTRLRVHFPSPPISCDL